MSSCFAITILRPTRRVILSLTLAATAGAQAASPPAARIDDVFKRFTAHTPGCALLVRKDGATFYSHSYGLASLELDVPITERTVFNIGSASKQFTAASILLLARDGKLSLDDDVRRYVPELPDLGATVTLRQLLTHTSGWRDYVQMLVWQGHAVRDYVTHRDALNLLERQRALNFRPGTEFRYSNTGYFLVSVDGSRAARSTSAMVRAVPGPAGSVYSVCGKLTAGTGAVANDESCVLPTTPTTVYQRLVASTRKRLPITERPVESCQNIAAVRLESH